MNSLTMYIPDALVHESWIPFLDSQREKLNELGDHLEGAISNGAVCFPDRELILRAFEMSIKDVRVLILGQDPYPTPGHAIGYSFATHPHVSPVPASLRNIFKEATADIGELSKVNSSLQSWRDQGVFLLNRVLTVESGAVGSHKKIGWEGFTESAVEFLIKRNPDVVAMLWGKDAESLKHLFDPSRVIITTHPSPLSANRGFLGSKPFSKCNDLLKQMGHQPVDWR
ncbi:unannotated protein [freshwater metagenome]|uniref:Unannotated protein n=1 Tax=freshwater metagenome TaxID=449393 RepID=A0A6J6P8J5_9ZZZZ